MKLDIEERKENPLLGRLEMRILVTHEKEATPKKDAIQEALMKELGEAKENVEITRIFSQKGICCSKAWAYIKKPELSAAVYEEIKKQSGDDLDESSLEGGDEGDEEDEEPAEKKKKTTKKKKAAKPKKAKKKK